VGFFGLTSDQIRQLFLDFFAARDHTIVPSSPLVPVGDPTLLFTNSGMVQFKNVFLGLEKRSYKRAASVQKCLRAGGKHNDLDDVGRTARHHSFFEMLGNWSFGDYFKREAIAYAWEFVIGELHLDPDRLWATIFETDDEAEALWREVAGLPADRIIRLGEKDNFWAMADTGPCGPSSEIHYDRGEAFRCDAPVCGIGFCDCDRFLEIWNLVFMQYDRDAFGVLSPLPQQHIDTGMGLERVAAILQGVPSNWETDLFQPLFARIEALSERRYTGGPEGFPFRVIADHARACAFLIADGVAPSNEGRGYVLKRILRRAVRLGRKLGLERPFLAAVAECVIDRMGAVYPELVERRRYILTTIGREEERFQRTLTAGLNMLEEVMVSARAGDGRVPGAAAFKLYDTFGFPLELTEEVVQENGLAVDVAGFHRAMEQQRELARANQRFEGHAQETARFLHLDLPPTEFLGYATLEAESDILAVLVEEQSAARASDGAPLELVLAATPFYGESGGQVGDTGEIRTPTGAMRVDDTVHPLPDLTVHRGRVVEGYLEVGQLAQARVDGERRLDIARNHTATHLLHAALRRVLGPHVRQSGSLVAPDRLRFDFSHDAALGDGEVREIERLVNEVIRRDLPVHASVHGLQQARDLGAIGLFGEKYGEQVRVIEVGDPEAGEVFSRELCGGTHLRASGQIGFCHIVTESSVGSGLRRMEAVTGRGAEQYFDRILERAGAAARRLQAPVEDLDARVETLLEEIERERKRSHQLQRELLKRDVERLLTAARQVNGVRLLATRVQVPTADGLREVGDLLRDKLGSGVILLAACVNEKPSLLAMVTPDLVARGLNAGRIVKQAAAVVGGGGGGRPEMAQAGGRDCAKLDQALAAVDDLLVPA
jgi:alanyl-tRNA synthetase